MTKLKICFANQRTSLAQSNISFFNLFCEEVEMLLSFEDTSILIQQKSNKKMVYVGR